MIKEDMFADSAIVEIKQFHGNIIENSANVSKIKLKFKRKKSTQKNNPQVKVCFQGNMLKNASPVIQ